MKNNYFNIWTQQILEKRHYLLSRIMKNKQVLVYGLLQSINDLRSNFVGHIHFKKLMKFLKFIEIFHCCWTRFRKKKNMGERNFKKHFKFHNFSEIFYCGMTRLRNTNLSAFIQCQYKSHWPFSRTILRNKNMGQSLFKKHSKFQNFDEIFYCGMTRLSNTNLDVFIQCQYK